MDSSMAAGEENSGSRSFENPQDIGRWLLQALKENATARSAIPDLEEKKNSSHGKRKTVCKAFTKPIYFLDPWNNRNLVIMEKAPGIVDPAMNIRNPMRKFKHLASLDAVKLREMRPDYIPVIMEKDARSDVPDVDMRRCHVYDGTPLREFVHFLRGHIHSKKPIFVFFKNTKPPNSALMSAIHEENKDEDGFLYVTYSGEKSYINEHSRGGSFDLGESSYKQENHLESMQAEQNNPDPIPMIVEKAAEKSDMPDIQEKRLAEKRRKRAYVDIMRNAFVYLEPWNLRSYKMALSSTPSMSENTRKFYLERYKQLYGNLSEEQRTCMDARQLREKRADYIPVSVEKDPRADSDVPDIDVKKYHVPRQKTLGEFVDLIQMDIAVSKTFHVRVFCKNTELPAGASMSAIDDEFKDGDGFLRLTYIGEERACQSAS
ncbi:uncharacterized protein LOC125473200 isoform X1 [Pyrus x bretschneideri]|uniref:uncharacterized protein LOC125473200 isoform X1 n=1 Tax=Pyrus x bretschneideri TaxID=225117 RepID=UPI0020300582|nr:uncharacterized protein LOC125473200 isoform X1 [Pyrus x bretschneideri]